MRRRIQIIVGFLGFMCSLGSGCSPTDKPCCSSGSKPASSPSSTPALSANQQRNQGMHCCLPASTNQSDLPNNSDATEPARQIVFKVNGLTCPAVKGLGCGHRIAPVLARLNKIEGVEKSFANRTGTMLRICTARSVDCEKVASAISQDLIQDKREPKRLVGEELKEALVQEKWGSPGDLSAIEFRTLALHRIQTFTESEKLNKETAEKLMHLAEQQWDRLAKRIDCCSKGYQPSAWLDRFKQFGVLMSDQTKEFLAADQVERLKGVFSAPLGKNVSVK